MTPSPTTDHRTPGDGPDEPADRDEPIAPDAPAPDGAEPSESFEGPDAPEGPGEPSGRRPTGGARWLPWALVGLLAATTLVFLGLWLGARGDEAPDVREAAVAFMTELTTWDASDGLEATTEALRGMGTGDFLDEVDEVLGSDVRATAEALGAVSAGTVTEVVLDPSEEGAAWTAIVFVEQTLTVAGVTEAQEQIARLVLVAVDGSWKVEVLELLNAPTPLDETTSAGADG